MNQSTWETISSEQNFANPHVEVVTDCVRTPSHTEGRKWTIVHRKAAVVVAPMTSEGKILLIRQERIPIHDAIWEMPSGQIDTRGADQTESEKVALRELHEETGYDLAKGGKLIPLGHYFSSPGFTDERGYFFLARPVVPRPDYVPDESESILECRAFTVSEIRRMIADNEIRDANTLGIFARLAASSLISLDSR